VISSGHSNLRLYSDALRSVAAELGRSPTFALQFDRMRIDYHLIHNLRWRQSVKPPGSSTLRVSAANPTMV